MCQASREAYAREHGLSAKVMADRVHQRRMSAARDSYVARWNRLFEIEPADWYLSPEEAAAVDKAFQTRNKPTIPVNPCKEITFENCAENIARGYPVAVMPDGKVAVDTENRVMEFDNTLKPEEAEVLSRLEPKRSEVPAAVENCGLRDICPGPCEHCNNPSGRVL